MDSSNQSEPITDLGPPMVIGCIMIAVGLALPLIAVVWMVRWVVLWARARCQGIIDN